MIEYTANRQWLRDLKHLGASWTLRRIVRASLIVGLYALMLSFVVMRLNLEGHRSISGTFSLLGVILSIVMVFRTNTAYDRWWEGRKLWGSLVNNVRNLSIHLDALLPDDDGETRGDCVRLLGDFALALSGHLRGEVDRDALSPATREEIGHAAHVPSAITSRLVGRIHAMRREGTIDGSDLIVLTTHTQALLDVSGACERIRKTPIPFSYSVFIKLFIILYAAILPVGLVPEYGYLAVPLTMLIVFALLGLELMAEEIEDPFGTDCNDLPTGTIAAAIHADAAVLLCREPSAATALPASYTKVF